jgi:D-aminopeptidase
MNSLARYLVIAGVVLLLAGGVAYLLGKLNLPVGHLPGDIRIVRENFACFFPLTTMILVSIVLSVLLNILIRLLNRK